MVNEIKEKWDFKERKELFTCSKCGNHSMDLSYGPKHPGICPECLIKEDQRLNFRISLMLEILKLEN